MARQKPVREKTVHINITVSPEEKMQLKIYAAKKGKTMSGIIQEIIARSKVADIIPDEE